MQLVTFVIILHATVYSCPAGNVELLNIPDENKEISHPKCMRDNHGLRSQPKSRDIFPVSIGHTTLMSW